MQPQWQNKIITSEGKLSQRGQFGCCSGNLSNFVHIHARLLVSKKQTHLSDVLLLLLTQRQLDEDLLQFLVAVVDDELLKAVVLWSSNSRKKTISST